MAACSRCLQLAVRCIATRSCRITPDLPAETIRGDHRSISRSRRASRPTFTERPDSASGITRCLCVAFQHFHVPYGFSRRHPLRRWNWRRTFRGTAGRRQPLTPGGVRRWHGHRSHRLSCSFVAMTACDAGCGRGCNERWRLRNGSLTTDHRPPTTVERLHHQERLIDEMGLIPALSIALSGTGMRCSGYATASSLVSTVMRCLRHVSRRVDRLGLCCGSITSGHG